MQKERTDTVISLYIDTEVYRTFKLYCVREGKTIREVGTKLLEDFVKKISSKKKDPVQED